MVVVVRYDVVFAWDLELEIGLPARRLWLLWVAGFTNVPKQAWTLKQRSPH